MKKITITLIFGLIGVVLWNVTNILRTTSLINIDALNFILGIMPNVAACWVFIWVGELIITKINNNYNFKFAGIVSGIIFLLAIISELIHDKFLNSPFDINDIIATILSIVVYLVSFYFSKRKYHELITKIKSHLTNFQNDILYFCIKLY